MKMKLAGVVLALGAALTITSIADVSVNFSINSSFRVYTDVTLTTQAPVDTWLAQLIWSSDGTANDLDPSNPLNPTGEEISLVILQPDQAAGYIFSTDYSQETNPQTGLPWPGSTTQTYTDLYYGSTLAGGYVYARFFYSTTPEIGDVYVELTPSAQLAAAPTANAYVLGQNVYFDTEIVPEPTTMALFGLGIVTLALRRKLRA